MASSGNEVEDFNRRFLTDALTKDFEVVAEVPVRHALFAVNLRVDLLIVPRDARFAGAAFAIEAKGHTNWDIPSLSKCLKQASDYVLATVIPSPNTEAKPFVGRRVMATFIYPAPLTADVDPRKKDFFEGMIHMAGYHRVGACYVSHRYSEKPLILECPNEVWVSSRGWRANAENILLGKRQVGSTRMNILDVLQKAPR